MRISSSDRRVRPFNLIRWFSLTALISIAVVSAIAAWVFSGFLTERMIRQEAEITAGFVRSIIATEHLHAHFGEATEATAQQLNKPLEQLIHIPSVLRMNVYSAERVMVWSSDRSLVGQRFERNGELEEALRANLVIHSGIIDPAHLSKLEHQHLRSGGNRFIESYIPILDSPGRQVLGVVELYKVPTELFEAIKAGVILIWLASGIAGLFLYLTLFWIVRRAHKIIEVQGDQLIESESLAIVGEMGSAVAHGLRNPLASIRSSAELSLGSTQPLESRECANDIMAQVDRLESWIRQLLTYAKPDNANLAAVDMNAVLRASMGNFSKDLERRSIKTSCQFADNLPAVRGEEAMLTQLLGSLIANAMEALKSSGEISVVSRVSTQGLVVAEVSDNGPGIEPDDMGRLFKPFFTSKAQGLGLGLPLVRRVVERLGGIVEVESAPGKGTTVRLHLPIWK